MFLRFAVLLISLIIVSNNSFCQDYYLPINSYNRTELSILQLTKIGSFGKERKMRPGIPAHLHTGIDIKRPTQNYNNEPILSIGEGIVISMRDDGPYAQIIIEHTNNDAMFWTVYEHIAGIEVGVGDLVDENTEIARYMSKSELNKYGWQFDHFHFEILKVPPIKVKPSTTQPQRMFKTYNLICYTFEDLDNYYFDPIEFLEDIIN